MPIDLSKQLSLLRRRESAPAWQITVGRARTAAAKTSDSAGGRHGDVVGFSGQLVCEDAILVFGIFEVWVCVARRRAGRVCHRHRYWNRTRRRRPLGLWIVESLVEKKGGRKGGGGMNGGIRKSGAGSEGSGGS